MNITEEQRKLLTEWLGECFRENCMGCPKEKEKYNCPSHYIDRRTFDNWTDFGVVVEKLRLHTIINLLQKIQATTLIMSTHKPKSASELPECFCILVAEAIKEGVTK